MTLEPKDQGLGLMVADHVTEILRQQDGICEATTFIIEYQGREVMISLVRADGYQSGIALRDTVLARLGDCSKPFAVWSGFEAGNDVESISVNRLRTALDEGWCVLFEEPSDALEAAVCEVWCDVLNLPTVGVRDEFLDIGGDSASALRILATLEERLDLTLTIRELMHASCVRNLADLIRTTTIDHQKSTGA
jgi:acyl carrier protein